MKRKPSGERRRIGEEREEEDVDGRVGDFGEVERVGSAEERAGRSVA